jgi:hypothetical protein
VKAAPHRWIALLMLASSLAGCTSIYDEVCNDYDGRPESIRARVLSGLTLPPSAQVIECLSRADGMFDDESCLISIAPADFEATFPGGKFGPDRPHTERRPYTATPHILAQAHGVALHWLRGSPDFEQAAGVFSNEARDRAVVYATNDRCIVPAEVISLSGTR